MRRFGRNLYMTLTLLLLYLPILVVVAYSFNMSKNGVLWTGFTTDWYKKLWESGEILTSFRNSLYVAGWSCLIAAVLGTLGAFGLTRLTFRGASLIESTAMMPAMLPEIVLGLAFMTCFAAAGLPFGMTTLVLSHAAFCVPYVLILVRARLTGLDPSWEDAARDLGATPARAFLTIVVPLALPSVLSGVLLSFAMSLDDMVISILVSGPETTTFPVYVYGKLKTNVPPSINAMCTVTLGVTFLAVALSQLVKAKTNKSVKSSGK